MRTANRHLFAYGTLRWALLPPAHRPGLARDVTPPPEQSLVNPIWNEEQFPELLRAVFERLRYAGTARVRGRLYDLGPYPAAILDPQADGDIVGDVYLLPPDPAVIVSLDAYEGYDARYPERSLFRRVPVAVRLTDNQTMPCWMYVYNRPLDNAIPIPEGDYLAYRRWNALATSGSLPPAV
jgi:gamma-glutamylcyclotransferase (GGCT)/AIG2-like uncharacterized protein YtfP